MRIIDGLKSATRSAGKNDERVVLQVIIIFLAGTVRLLATLPLLL
jgi:hypothetical protein